MGHDVMFDEYSFGVFLTVTITFENRGRGMRGKTSCWPIIKENFC
jgi:hypothetical protein